MLRATVTGLIFMVSAGVTHAAPILLFQDDFESEAPAGTALNYGAFTHWDLVSGTADLIASGDYSIDCAGGTGFCVDSDGSTGAAGRLVTKTVFNLVGGRTYRMYVDVSGNQRNGSTEQFQFGFGSALDPTANLETMTLLAVTGDSFVTRDFGLNLLALSDAVTFERRLFLQGVGGDNIGAIIDNVRLECTTGCDAASIPEPATLALFGAGLAALGFRRGKSKPGAD